MFGQKNAGDDQINNKEAIARDDQAKRGGRYIFEREPDEYAYRRRDIKPRMMCGVFSE
ncbi:hypothetical protein [Parvibaculum sp.]|uniref:hypothetical protein n=1 Tax=Parvibaculum sp. TaxID=2024848 RepID=UPI0025CC30AC|nr:hypothetical protein [Parvibaculum sp.]